MERQSGPSIVGLSWEGVESGWGSLGQTAFSLGLKHQENMNVTRVTRSSNARSPSDS